MPPDYLEYWAVYSKSNGVRGEVMNSLKWSVHLNGKVKIKIEKTKLVLFRNSKLYTLASNAKVKILVESIAKSGLPVEVAQAIDKKTISFLIYWELAEFRLFEKGKPVIATNVLFMNFRQQKQKQFVLGSQSIIHFEKNIPIIRNCMNNNFVKFFDQKLFSRIISRTADLKKNKYNQFLNSALSADFKNGFEIDFEKLMIERTSIPFLHAELNQDNGKILKPKSDILLNFDKRSKPKRSVTRIFSDSEIPFQKISTLFSVIGKGDIWNHSYFGKRIRRPYPSGGGAYEIDFYYISIRSEKINPGLYHYNGLKHMLQPIASKEEDLRLITQLSQDSTGERNCRAAGILILVSDLSLLRKKYTKTPYRISLLNAGVVLAYVDQTLNRIKLGGCPLGTSNWGLLNRVLNLDGVNQSACLTYVLGGTS